MKNSQSKFSNKKYGKEANSGSGTKPSGCCCGSQVSEEIDEFDITETEDK